MSPRIDYYLKSAASGPITLEILGAAGKVVRRYSSDDEVFRPDPATIDIPPHRNGLGYSPTKLSSAFRLRSNVMVCF